VGISIDKATAVRMYDKVPTRWPAEIMGLLRLACGIAIYLATSIAFSLVFWTAGARSFARDVIEYLVFFSTYLLFNNLYRCNRNPPGSRLIDRSRINGCRCRWPGKQTLMMLSLLAVFPPALVAPSHVFILQIMIVPSSNVVFSKMGPIVLCFGFVTPRMPMMVAIPVAVAVPKRHIPK
jgi:hypothetical protein